MLVVNKEYLKMQRSEILFTKLNLRSTAASQYTSNMAVVTKWRQCHPLYWWLARIVSCM